MSAEIVEQQDLGIEGGAVRGPIACAGGVIIARADLVEQILIIEEDAFEAARNQNTQRGYSQMRLAGARLANQQKP